MALVFLTVAFLAAGALGVLQPLTGVPTEVIQLTQFGPALGVLVVALCWRRRTSGWLAGAFRVASPGGRSLLLPLTAVLALALSVISADLLAGHVVFTPGGPLRNNIALIVVAQFVGACAEEIGWRCLLQPMLRTKFGPLTTSVIVGLVWGVWHVGVFGYGPWYTAIFLVSTVSMSVTMGLALDGVGAHRLVLAGGFHLLINLGLLLFLDVESGALLPEALFAAACLITALLWVVRRPATIAGVSGRA
jgi:uncharacterized protein